MTFGERINKIRTDKHMTQDELAHAVGYKSRSTIAKIESGERDASQSMIVALAKALDTTPSVLMGWEDEKSTPIVNDRSAVIERINSLTDSQLGKREAENELEAVPSLTTQPEYRGFNILKKENVYMIPIFKSVSAGFGSYADDQVCGYEPVYFDSSREAAETIAIAVKGDSMYPKIEEDDLVIVHKQDYFENGDIIVAVICSENEGVVKRAFRSESKLTLESINTAYPPLIFSGSKLEDVKIMGVVRKIIKSV